MGKKSKLEPIPPPSTDPRDVTASANATVKCFAEAADKLRSIGDDATRRAAIIKDYCYVAAAMVDERIGLVAKVIQDEAELSNDALTQVRAIQERMSSLLPGLPTSRQTGIDAVAAALEATDNVVELRQDHQQEQPNA